MSLEKYKLHEEAFDYRAWAVMVTADPEIFLTVVQRAVTEAKKYNINRIEFHDWVYAYPTPEGFVENVIRYKNFEKLKGIEQWTFDNRCFDRTDKPYRTVSNAELEKMLGFLRRQSLS